MSILFFEINYIWWCE